jgi:hypothetical protein
MTRAACFCQTSFSVFTLSSPECSNEIKDGGKCVRTALSFSPTLWRQSPKFEGRNPKSRKAGRKPKPETRQPLVRRSGFRISGFFRTSDFDLRIYAAPTVSISVQSGFVDALHNFVFRLASRQLYWGRD